MKKKYQWTKSGWKSTFNINEENIKRGELKFSSFLDKASGMFNGLSCTFKSQGFFKYSTIIIDNNTDSEIGRIEYNLTMSKATIYLKGNRYECVGKDSWTNKSKKIYANGEEVHLEGSSSKGEIETNTDNDLLLFSSFFTTHFSWQMVTVSLIACFVPIIVVFLGIIA